MEVLHLVVDALFQRLQQRTLPIVAASHDERDALCPQQCSTSSPSCALDVGNSSSEAGKLQNTCIWHSALFQASSKEHPHFTFHISPCGCPYRAPSQHLAGRSVIKKVGSWLHACVLPGSLKMEGNALNRQPTMSVNTTDPVPTSTSRDGGDSKGTASRIGTSKAPDALQQHTQNECNPQLRDKHAQFIMLSATISRGAGVICPMLIQAVQLRRRDV